MDVVARLNASANLISGVMLAGFIPVFISSGSSSVLLILTSLKLYQTMWPRMKDHCSLKTLRTEPVPVPSRRRHNIQQKSRPYTTPLNKTPHHHPQTFYLILHIHYYSNPNDIRKNHIRDRHNQRLTRGKAGTKVCSGHILQRSYGTSPDGQPAQAHKNDTPASARHTGRG